MNLDFTYEHIDKFCLTATWLTDKVRISEIFLTRQFFVQSKNDRRVGAHGGFLIAHKTNLCFTQATEIAIKFDFLSCSVYFLYNLVLMTITLYNPPQNSKNRVSDTDLRSSVRLVLFKLALLFDSSTQKELINMNGHVNFSHPDWNTLSSRNDFLRVS